MDNGEQSGDAGAASRAPLVLMYHRIADDANDPFGIVVHPLRFREHLRRLAALTEVVPLGDLARPGSERPRVAVTFDDGYVDNLDNALPELERAGACATVFVIAGRIGARDECWWDQLEQIFRRGWEGARPIELEAPEHGETLTATLRCDPDTLGELHRKLLRYEPGRIYELLEGLRLELGLAPAQLERRLMSPEELLRLAGSGVVEIGAHTLSHPVLSDLGVERQVEELLGSRNRLEALLRRPVTSCSYPFGAHDATTLAIAERCGFEYALAAQPANASGWTRYSIPRRAVENWDGYEFETRLRAWLG